MQPFEGTRYILISAKTGTIHTHKDVDETEQVALFRTRDLAISEASKLVEADPNAHYLVHGPISRTGLDWRQRERIRLSDRYYHPLGDSLMKWTVPDHFAHAASGDPRSIAYTKTDADGVRDIQKRMRVSAYLKQYAPTLSERQMMELEADHVKVVASDSLLWARSAEQIEHVYTHYDENYSGVASSCMRHSTGDFQSSRHPTAAYGDSDLCVAYTEGEDGVTARTVVYEREKVYSRCYGSDTSIGVLMTLLEQAGFDKSAGYYASRSKTGKSLAGARLRALVDPHRGENKLIMPYLDECSWGQLSEDRQWITLISLPSSHQCRAVSLRETSGIATCNLYTCQRCSVARPTERELTTVWTQYLPSDAVADETNTQQWCPTCTNYPRTFICANDGRRYSRDSVPMATAAGERTYVREWAREHIPMCQHCNTFVESADDLTSVRWTSTEDKQLCPACLKSQTFWCNGINQPVASNYLIEASLTGKHRLLQRRKLPRGLSVFAPELETFAEGFYADIHRLALREVAGECLDIVTPTGRAVINNKRCVVRYVSLKDWLYVYSTAMNQFKPVEYDASMELPPIVVGNYVKVLTCLVLEIGGSAFGAVVDVDNRDGDGTWSHEIALDDGRVTWACACDLDFVSAERPADLPPVPQLPPIAEGEYVVNISRDSVAFGRLGTVTFLRNDGLLSILLDSGGYRNVPPGHVERRRLPAPKALCAAC